MAPQQYPRMVYRRFAATNPSGNPNDLADPGGQGAIQRLGDLQDLDYKTVHSAAEQSALTPGMWYLDIALTQLAN